MANRIISSLHFQYSSLYFCNSQQGTLLYYSNIAYSAQLSHLPMKFCRNTSKGPYHYKDNFYISQFPQSFDLEIMVVFHFFFLFFLYSYISWYSNINNYTLLFFLVNNYQVRLSCLYQIVTLDIYVPQYFDLFILYCSFQSMLILLFTVFLPVLFTNIRMNFLCNIIVSSFVFFLRRLFTSACQVLHSGFIDVVLGIVCPDCLLMCGTQQCFCFSL